MVSATRRARARYSASIEDRETLGCFFVHQEIRFGPKKMRNPDVDFLSFLSFAQSESENPRSSKSPGRMSKPWPRVPKMYLRMHFRKWLSCSLGWCMHWETRLTANWMSGRVMARYCRAPMRLQKWVISAKGVSTPFVNEETSIGVGWQVHFSSPTFCNRSRALIKKQAAACTRNLHSLKIM